MNTYRYFFILFALLSVVLPSQAQEVTERPEWAGVWIDRKNRPADFITITDYIDPSDIAGEAGRIQWRHIEPNPGEFDFSRIQEFLERARDNDYYYYFVLWTGHHSPEWIYNEGGVPKVYMREETWAGNDFHPYYVHENFRTLAKNMFAELAAYLAGLPKNLSERLAFIQPGFGATGDRQLYKGEPFESQYEINSDEYLDYMQDMTLALTGEFNKYPETENIRFLWNIDDFDGSDPSDLEGISDRLLGERLYSEWVRSNYETQLRKQQFTIAIGYMDPNEMNQDNRQRAAFYGYETGIPEFVRGEFNDSRWPFTDIAEVSLPWYYYWTAISSVDRGLDGWEIEWSGLQRAHEYGFLDALRFSTRHSFYKQPETSPHAFIALRDVLDYSDDERFPSSEYGAANRNNTSRINAILDAYSAYGAANDDTPAVQNRNGAQYFLNSKGLNDVMWNVIDRNYQRHMVQIDPNETSVGWWRVGSKDEPYGRFARAFENSTGRDTMYFQFVDGFIKSPPSSVDVKVIYYDEFEGSTWELRYDNGSGDMAVALSVTGEGEEVWKTETVTLSDAVFARNGARGADLVLVNTDDHDDKFHMIEITRTPDSMVASNEIMPTGWDNASAHFPGWLNDTYAPWIWSNAWGKWLYMPDEGMLANGNWFFVPRNF